MRTDFQFHLTHLIYTNLNNYSRFKHIFISVEMIKMQIRLVKYHIISIYAKFKHRLHRHLMAANATRVKDEKAFVKRRKRI